MFEIILYVCLDLSDVPCRPGLEFAQSHAARQANEVLVSTVEDCQVQSLAFQDWVRAQMTPEENRRFSFATDCVPVTTKGGER